jgi:cell division protein FtsN
MAHDFASNRGRSQKKRNPKARKSSFPKPSAGTLLSVLALLGFGLGLYLLAGITPESSDTPTTTPQAVKKNPAIPTPAQERLTSEQENSEPTYTFYEKLKEMQSWEPGERVDIRKPKEKDTDSAPKKVSASKASGGTTSSTRKPYSPTVAAADKKYILQAGSYRSFEDANNQRVKLIINGIRNTKIDTVTLANGKVGHRIEVGPFSSQQEAQKVKQQLAKLKVSSFSRTVK